MAWFNYNWQYRKKITINNTKVPSAQTDFPILYTVTDADLKYTGSGGRVGKSNGGDILFTSSDGITQLKHEIELYTSTTGELVAWIKIPSLASAVDTEIYIYYGNASASDQEDPTNVWNSNYVAVWHMNQDPSGSGKVILDSKGSGTTYDGDPNEMESADLVSGKIGKALNFDGSPEAVVLDTNLTWPTSALSMQVWCKATSLDGYLLSLTLDSGNNKGAFLNLTSGGYFRFGLGNGSTWTQLYTSSTYSTGSWHIPSQKVVFIPMTAKMMFFSRTLSWGKNISTVHGPCRISTR